MSFRYAFLALMLAVGVVCTGCGTDESETSTDESGATAQADASASEEDLAAEDDPAPDAESAPAAKPGPIGLMKDVAIAPSATDAPPASAFIFYMAKEEPTAVAEFHKKDLEGKGWKISRNEQKKLPGTTMSGTIQQYEKGSDVLTVVLTPQVSEYPLTSVCVMDIPLPPAMTYINPYGGQGSGEIGMTPDEAIAWFSKELSARGWTADKPQETGGTHAVNFRKGQRTLSTQFRPTGVDRKSSSFYFMHMG